MRLKVWYINYVMKDLIYYSIKKVPNNFTFKKALPNNIIEYVKNKHLANLNSSLFAWGLLNQLSSLDLSKVNFLKSGKPTINGASFSISHSKSYVAIAYCYSPIPLGIDIEKIEDRNLDFLSKILKDCEFSDNATKYKLWTEHEATVKALNLNVLKDASTFFKGISITVQTDDGEFSLSIYSDIELNVKEIDFENII